MIDLLYVAFNRLAMTRASFTALLENTDWSLVRWLHVHDDGSTDGTFEYLREAMPKQRSNVSIIRVGEGNRDHGPVAAMNRYLAWNNGEAGDGFLADEPAELFAKVDNDMVMPPRWLNDLYDVMRLRPELHILGTEPFVGLDAPPPITVHPRTDLDGAPLPSGYTPARHIGGKGLIRTSAFDGRPMWADGYQGFTQWQHNNEAVTKGWITPDLRSFGLDQLPLEPWASLTEEYVAAGWQRAWPKYAPASHAYWDWWLEQQALAQITETYAG